MSTGNGGPWTGNSPKQAGYQDLPHQWALGLIERSCLSEWGARALEDKF